MSDRQRTSGARAGSSRGGRLLGRALARPSLPALVGLAVVSVVFGLQAPALVTTGGLASVLNTAALLGIGGVAVGLLLIAGQFDLSVGVLAVASPLLTALLVQQAGWGLWPALSASLAAALAVGLVNGVLVVNTGLPSFLVTLATFLILQGVSQAGTLAVAGSGRLAEVEEAPGWDAAVAVFGSTVQVGDGRFRVALLWWVGVTALATWALWRTRFGNAVFASGGARTAARQLGVPVRRTTLALFCLTASAGWLIGTLGLVRIGGVAVGSPVLSTAIDFIVVAVLGGCLLTGGYGSAIGASVGAILYAVSREGIVLAGWDPLWFRALLGVLLLVALLATGVVRRRLKAVPRS
ncbi:simple sugar transport system permease protein [Blastococcus colisei]|uniref:Xylose transport system permease protein XylH n=2 Tax=Blastococcus colisei TaxID=1564162 RepID=A0A543PAH5_9ACTN|nr:simple sugar transport system permease protein [Blastococcus colisei]